MSILKKGVLCVIIGGCPENIGLIVEVVSHLGRHEGREDAYEIKTVTSRKFNQLWSGTRLVKGYSTEAITDRHKLRPLINLGDEPPLAEYQEKLDAITI
ncbi:hypothetical protein [Polynucleobacter sp. es-EL-1]|uniref:hypothetical protein n=1 Tax=Polynucleobacter sp. es-EL-1 TaxID=1855652 RepID=UPI001BFEE88A|nr:hypothetical protein [Polynucleobacter sp. es-EL-1]QWE11170.1 hypothetical protein FD974_03285 [Polynucleobacter sp. es-EL-1]